jgi:hypothetical protein
MEPEPLGILPWITGAVDLPGAGPFGVGRRKRVGQLVPREDGFGFDQVQGPQHLALSEIHGLHIHLELHVAKLARDAGIVQHGLQSIHVLFLDEQGCAAQDARLGDNQTGEGMFLEVGLVGLGQGIVITQDIVQVAEGSRRRVGLGDRRGVALCGGEILFFRGLGGRFRVRFVRRVGNRGVSQEQMIHLFQRRLDLGIGPDHAEFQPGGLAQQVLGPLGILQTGKFHDDPAGSEGGDLRLGHAELVDPVVDDLLDPQQGVLGLAGVHACLVDFQDQVHAALEIQSAPDGSGVDLGDFLQPLGIVLGGFAFRLRDGQCLEGRQQPVEGKQKDDGCQPCPDLQGTVHGSTPHGHEILTTNSRQTGELDRKKHALTTSGRELASRQGALEDPLDNIPDVTGSIGKKFTVPSPTPSPTVI